MDTIVVVKIALDISSVPAEHWDWCEHCAAHIDHCDCAEQN